MFGFSMGEMLLIMAIALIAIGPKQLPEVARTIGKLMGELKRATGDFTKSFNDVRDDTQKTWGEARKGMNDVFTAGAASYAETVRAPPAGVVSTHPITPDDPFGVGHNSNAHPYDAHGQPLQAPDIEVDIEADAQGSLFVPTDLSNVSLEDAPRPHPAEEQLSFILTSFDDDASETRGGGQGSSHS